MNTDSRGKGTWLNADSGKIRDQANIPSNVTRIARAIKKQSSDGIAQIVYYHFGIGSQGGIVDRLYGGITGEGPKPFQGFSTGYPV